MTGYSKVFVDTAPIIYFLDEDVHFGEKARLIFEEILSEGKQIISSSVTCLEYLVYPYRNGNQEKVDVFFEFAEREGLSLISITVDIAKIAAKIRAEYTSFKAMDAIQLAVAMTTGCDVFLTNDDQLKQYKGIKVLTVEEWVL